MKHPQNIVEELYDMNKESVGAKKLDRTVP